MKPIVKIGLVLGQAAVIVIAFKAGERAKARPVNASPWEAYSSRVPPGAALNPVPLNVEGLNVGIVFRGSYLVNAVQHCNSCHTSPPYAIGAQPSPPFFMPAVNAVNYMAGGRRFGAQDDPNAVVSPNLTPDPKTGLPGGLTLDEFRTALRTGRAHETGRKLKVMPWPMFNDLSGSDLHAIYEYLRAIPHAEPGAQYPPVTESRTQESEPPG